MISYLKHLFIKIVGRVSPLIGELYGPWTRKKITAKDYHSFMAMNLDEGTVLCSKTNGEFGNLFIPDFWSHCAIYDGNGKVIEAVGKGVIETDLIDFLMTKDFVVALDPIFATIPQKSAALECAKSQLGKPYDFEFQTSDVKAFYCGELVLWAYTSSVPTFDFVLKKIFGVYTVPPQDFVNAKKYFKIAWKSLSVK